MVVLVEALLAIDPIADGRNRGAGGNDRDDEANNAEGGFHFATILSVCGN